MQRVWGILLAAIVLCGIACGDGVFIYTEKVPVGVPYQRAAIIFEGGKETLIVQSKYELQAGQTSPTLAWIVPAPSVPELASVDAISADRAFLSLGWGTGPTVVHVGRRIAGWLALLLGVLAVGLVASAGFFHKGTWLARHKEAVVTWSIAYIVVLLFWMTLMPAMGKMASSIGGVDIVKAETVGIYDVKVIRGEDPGAIIAWLKNNGFSCKTEQERVFADYVEKGWCFVTAKVQPSADPNLAEVVSSGLAAPLILRFETEEAVYPMALTATAGGETEVVLYVVAKHKMECSGRVPMLVASTARRYPEFMMMLAEKVEPAGFFLRMNELGYRRDMTQDQFEEFVYAQSSDGENPLYVSKFKAKMTPEQMKEDVIFKQAVDDGYFRERVIRWW